MSALFPQGNVKQARTVCLRDKGGERHDARLPAWCNAMPPPMRLALMARAAHGFAGAEMIATQLDDDRKGSEGWLC
ncbi:hypothetical protein GCM10027343_40860 [Noviherbaspirillum agri]